MRPGLRVALHGLQRADFNHHCGVVDKADVQIKSLVLVDDDGGDLERLHGRKGKVVAAGAEGAWTVRFEDGDVDVPATKLKLARVGVRVDAGVFGTGATCFSLAPERLAPRPVNRGLGFGGPSPKQLERVLAPLLPCWPHVQQFLLVPDVRHEDVQVAACSSSRGDFPLASCLEANDKWWISDGPCTQWLELDLGGRRCVSSLGLRIPPLPMGPLSVRAFRVEAQEPGGWRTVLEALTRDAEELQEFALGVEAERLRLVCATTASPDMPCVGLYEVRLG